MPVAVVTGASRGLGLALTRALIERGWELVVDARDGAALDRAVDAIGARERLTAIPGDVADAAHRDAVARAVEQRGGALDLLVNNASILGPTPMPPLAAYPLDGLAEVLRINTLAPLGLVQRLLPALAAAGGAVVNITSDAAVEPYAGWGGYGASKAALDQLSAILGAEQPEIRVYAFDPGDMRTAMHQDAFPGEDISDRPAPESVVPALLRLLDRRPASGRHRAADLVAGTRGAA